MQAPCSSEPSCLAVEAVDNLDRNSADGMVEAASKCNYREEFEIDRN